MLVVVALVASASRDARETVDDIAIGMSRSQAESLLGRPLGKVTISDRSNSTNFDYGSAGPAFAVGNHPESLDDEPLAVRECTAYKDGFPCLGYDKSDRVCWVYGWAFRRGSKQVTDRVSLAPFTKQLLFDGQSATARPGYCMDGPWAFTCLNGRLEILETQSGPGESTPLFALRQKEPRK